MNLTRKVFFFVHSVSFFTLCVCLFKKNKDSFNFLNFSFNSNFFIPNPHDLVFSTYNNLIYRKTPYLRPRINRTFFLKCLIYPGYLILRVNFFDFFYPLKFHFLTRVNRTEVVFLNFFLRFSAHLVPVLSS
jgi:hypothetical protein